MKPFKVLGPVVVVAFAAMAVVGASSAMAGSTQICKTDTEPCGSSVTHVHFTDPLALLHAEGAFGVLFDILCEALFLGEALGLGAPQIIHGEFTYSGPHGAGGPCVNMKTGGGTENCKSVKEVGTLGGLLSVLKEGSELASVTGSEFEILLECGGFHCVYTWEGLQGHGLGPLLAGGGTKGTTSMSAQPVKKISGFLCPETSKLTTTSEALEATYIKS